MCGIKCIHPLNNMNKYNPQIPHFQISVFFYSRIRGFLISSWKDFEGETPPQRWPPANPDEYNAHQFALTFSLSTSLNIYVAGNILISKYNS